MATVTISIGAPGMSLQIEVEEAELLPHRRANIPQMLDQAVKRAKAAVNAMDEAS